MPVRMHGPMASPASNLVGRVIHDRLELTELLGAGSMGQVYKATHRALQKSVAIKVMRPEMPPTGSQIARFEAEAKATSSIDHPNSVQILDFGRDGEDQLLYIAMEFLDGEPLSRLIKRESQLEPSRAVRIILQTLAALAAAHDQKIVHRDVKPTNIMLVTKTGDDGAVPEFVKVCDFGIAKLLHGDHDTPPLTMEGVSLGTPAYSAPEQIMGMPVDGRADIYACGVVMYLLLTGRRPFTGEAMDVAMKQVSAQPEPIVSLRAGLDPALVAVVERAMAKQADDRFTTAREMRTALKPFLRESGGGVGPPGPPLPYPREATVPPQITPPPPFQTGVGARPYPMAQPPPGYPQQPHPSGQYPAPPGSNWPPSQPSGQYPAPQPNSQYPAPQSQWPGHYPPARGGESAPPPPPYAPNYPYQAESTIPPPVPGVPQYPPGAYPQAPSTYPPPSALPSLYPTDPSYGQYPPPAVGYPGQPPPPTYPQPQPGPPEPWVPPTPPQRSEPTRPPPDQGAPPPAPRGPPPPDSPPGRLLRELTDEGEE